MTTSTEQCSYERKVEMIKKADSTANGGISDAEETPTGQAAAEGTSATAPDASPASGARKGADEAAASTTSKQSLGSRLSNLTIGIKGVAATLAVIGVVVVIAILGVQLHSKSDEVDRMNAHSSDNAAVEKKALDYAVGAADMDFANLEGWRSRLVEGATPELKNRLTQAAASMEQIIVPLQWVSTAQPIAAKVSSETGGVYNVDCFVNVLTKNSQAPDGIQSTATYKLTVNKNDNWAITEISGIDSALGGNEKPK